MAADRRLPLAFVAGAALTCGLLNGFFNGATLAGAGSSGLAAAGIGCGVFVIVALVAGQVAALREGMGAHHGSRGRQLDRRHRLTHARLGDSVLRPTIANGHKGSAASTRCHDDEIAMEILVKCRRIARCDP